MTRRILFLALFACRAFAQGEDHEAFEAVSIKKSPPPEPGFMPHLGCRGGPESKDPGLWTCENEALRMVVQQAYDVRPFQIVWPGRQPGLFHISARLRPGISKDQFHLTLQDLLKERFHFAFHWEAKEIPVYEMTVGKGGPKFKESVENTDTEAGAAGPERGMPIPKVVVGKDGCPIVPPEFAGGMFKGSRGLMQLPHGTLADFAATLTLRLGRPVIDATGLQGAYRITVCWSTDAETPLGGAAPPAPAPEADLGPTLEAAVEQQLGLKLTGKRATVKMLVIDHVDSSPTEN